MRSRASSRPDRRPGPIVSAGVWLGEPGTSWAVTKPLRLLRAQNVVLKGRAPELGAVPLKARLRVGGRDLASRGSHQHTLQRGRLRLQKKDT